MNIRKPLSFVLVKPAGPDCNLDCTYCFYKEKEELFGAHQKHRMDSKTLEQLTKLSLGRPGTTMSFGWQGGEPTLMGLEFYQEVIKLQQAYGSGMRVSNSIQTNGMVLTEEWFDFFRRYSFLVGLSLDGPQHIHDRYRLDYSGRGTHEKVERVARALLASHVEVNALSVVTEYAAQYAQETYSYLKELGFTYMQFIPCLEMDPQEPAHRADFSVTPSSFGKFLCELFDLWAADFVDGKPTTSIRQFDTYASIYLGQTAPECTVRRTCGDYLVVEHTGDVYSCDFFVDETWHLGNIWGEKTLEDMLNSPKQELFGKMKARLPDRCYRCPWLSFCYGGCPKDRLRDPATRRFNPFCESYKIFFSYADSTFKTLMNDYRSALKSPTGIS